MLSNPLLAISITKGSMGAVQAVNIGYSPKHAAPPPPPRPSPRMRRLRNLVLGVSAFGLLATGAGLAIARWARQPPEQCQGYPGCVAVSASRPPGVVIDSGSAFGLHRPT